MNQQYLIDLDQRIREWLHTLDETIPQLISQMHTSTKKDRFDIVTNVDQTIQEQFETFLEEHYPEHQLFAEEKSNEHIDARYGHTWMMDPIDGTMNLVKQQEDYCVILAYFIDGEPMLSYIYDYPHRHLYHAIRDRGAYKDGEKLQSPATIEMQDAILSFGAQFVNNATLRDLFDASFSHRIIGSCGLDSVRVITGQFGAHFNTNPKPWDIAAQFLFARELGLKMTNLRGEALDFTKAGPFIISNPGCHEAVLEVLQRGEGYEI